MKRSEVERAVLRKSEHLCALVEDLGYDSQPRQLQCNNGAHVSSLMHFFDDNPGAVEAVREWVLDNAELEDNDDEDEEEYEEVDESDTYDDEEECPPTLRYGDERASA